MHIERVGDFSLQWGESVRWDDRRRRLYFVDCATQTLHWLEGAEPPLRAFPMPSLPTGIALTEDGRIVVALQDGLHVVDPDGETTELLTPYPDGLHGRANDVAADLDGNLVTGTLNVAPGPGAYWWYSTTGGWRELDGGIGNANGPVVLDLEGEQTLVFADTLAAVIYAYPYDGAVGSVGERRVFAEIASLDGFPDGACADAEGGIWGCVLGAGTIARHTSNGVDRVVDAGVELPSDVTFGGAGLDRMFFTSIAIPIGGQEITSPHAGALMVVEGLGHPGRAEPRFHL